MAVLKWQETKLRLIRTSARWKTCLFLSVTWYLQTTKPFVYAEKYKQKIQLNETHFIVVDIQLYRTNRFIIWTRHYKDDVFHFRLSVESSYSASYLNNTHREASESAETVATVLKISTQRGKYLALNTEGAKTRVTKNRHFRQESKGIWFGSPNLNSKSITVFLDWLILNTKRPNIIANKGQHKDWSVMTSRVLVYNFKT